MPSVKACRLPDDALLARYNREGIYTDSYVTRIPGRASHEDFVRAFYTTRLFRVERFILNRVASSPSTDAQAAQLAAGTINQFAAWHLEDRSENQLLLSDFQGRTRSWLMVAPPAADAGAGAGTLLYFGSAVVTGRKTGAGSALTGFLFRVLLVFHRIYSVALLRAAATRLKRPGQDVAS